MRYFSQNISLSEKEGEWGVSKSYWGMIISLALCFYFSIYKIVNSDVFSPRNLMHFELIYLKNFAKKRIMDLLTSSILISVFLQFICHLYLISVLFFAILFWTVISPVEKSSNYACYWKFQIFTLQWMAVILKSLFSDIHQNSLMHHLHM